MELKSDLSKARIGDWVCVATVGWAKITQIAKNNYPIGVDLEPGFRRWHTLDGKVLSHDKYPTCFPAGQVPKPYLDLFGPPPYEFKDGEPVWFSNDNVNWYAGVFKKPEILRFKNGVSKQIYYVYPMCSGCSDLFEYCAPWNNGQPPKEE